MLLLFFFSSETSQLPGAPHIPAKPRITDRKKTSFLTCKCFPVVCVIGNYRFLGIRHCSASGSKKTADCVMCCMASSWHSAFMQSAELIVETRTLPIEEQAASTDLFDSIALRAELKWLDEVDHPWGPFATYERHLEYILSQYEITAPESFTVHAPRIHTQKESLI